MRDDINRFKWARQNLKKESVKTVSQNTGIPRSLIDDLETNAGRERGVAYQKIKTLAIYFGVSIDWLVGILPFDNWCMSKDSRAASEQTGLSSSSLEQLNKVNALSKKGNAFFNVLRLKEAYDFFITNSSASEILTRIYNYLYADLGTVYRRNDKAIYSMEYLPFGNEKEKKESIPSSELHLLLNEESDSVGSSRLYFSLTEDDYADVLLKRITDDLKKLRKKVNAVKGDS